MGDSRLVCCQWGACQSVQVHMSCAGESGLRLSRGKALYCCKRARADLPLCIPAFCRSCLCRHATRSAAVYCLLHALLSLACWMLPGSVTRGARSLSQKLRTQSPHSLRAFYPVSTWHLMYCTGEEAGHSSQCCEIETKATNMYVKYFFDSPHLLPSSSGRMSRTETECCRCQHTSFSPDGDSFP